VKDVRRLIEAMVFPWPSTETLFNPYASAHPGADLASACRIRRANLRGYLDSFPARPPLLVVGEAPGPKGCGFSGVPFTSEQQLCSGALPFSGKQSSTAALPHHERTAGIFWEVMAGHFPRCFIWNAVPLHPHLPGDPFSLRRPCAAEMKAFAPLLSELIALLQPEGIVAVGRVAEQALLGIGQSCHYVRHPSHGGMTAFRTGMETLLEECAL
jgi:uracil-DNA glycosylase